MKTFHQFLLCATDSADPVGDLAKEVASDPRTTRTTAKVIDYLERRRVDEDALNEALARWKGSKRAAA
jgi:hypothetical protein